MPDPSPEPSSKCDAVERGDRVASERGDGGGDGEVESSPRFVTVAKAGALAEGSGGTFVVGERLVAVFLRGGEYHAIDDLCPHMGASLGAGGLDEDGAVVCPWHAWRFAIADGTWCDNPRIKIDSYEVRVVGEEIQVATMPRPRTK